MKITAQEEYGLRVLIRIASCKDAQGISIPQLSEAEGLSSHYIAKLARTLRIAEVINSTPGNKGGYVLARPAKEIIIRDVLAALGGVMFDRDFCEKHNGTVKLCTNSVNCSARSLWNMIQFTVDKLLSQITLHDLVSSETESMEVLRTLVTDESIVLNRVALTP
ncbi:MAG: Rrf2 family transcriptional regulator [Chitinophagaceae bacterium]|nr:MAG: Rrf2 family transcriptional regulator [Chitinophagaceae bacterium]